MPYGILFFAQLWSFLKSSYLGMKISINNEWQEVAAEATLQSIVYARLGDKQQGTAVAVNSKIVPRTEHANRLLQEGDVILIIKATQGG
jgi:sulfur carrier protein